jgi:hypothetical protein
MSRALSLELTVSEISAKHNISNKSFTEDPRVIFQLRQVFQGYLCVTVVRNAEGIRDLGEL